MINNFKNLEDMTENKKNFTEVFVAENGKKGVKNPNGDIIVPANYDDIAYTYDYSVLKNYPYVCVRDGKKGLVAPDGKGTELTEFVYDDIALVEKYVGTCLLYWKGGNKQIGVMANNGKVCSIQTKCNSKQFGIMANNGKEITPCKLDMYSETGQTIYFKSGEHWGLWQMEIGELLEPIYDDIRVDDPDEPIVFTLDGKKGYVKVGENSFIPLSMEKAMGEDEWHDLLLECIHDQYIDD